MAIDSFLFLGRFQGDGLAGLNFLNFLTILTGETRNDLDLIAKQLLSYLCHKLHHVMRIGVVSLNLARVIVETEQVLRFLEQVLEVLVVKELILCLLHLKFHPDELFFFILKVHEHKPQVFFVVGHQL